MLQVDDRVPGKAIETDLSDLNPSKRLFGGEKVIEARKKTMLQAVAHGDQNKGFRDRHFDPEVSATVVRTPKRSMDSR